MRWSYRKGALKVDDLQPILDELTPADVIWCPLENHRVWHQFDELCLYRGCLRWGDTVVLYLPGIYMRQFGYRQYVPYPPLDHTMIDDGYLEWYYRVSHPRLLPPPYHDAPIEMPVPVYEAGPSDPSWARTSLLIHRYLQQAGAEDDDPQFADLFEALHIARPQ
ncbi:unnamed protein product [Lathyrus sativus]|nr:unnamed protein product [Lathyrus sativus]